MPTMIDAGICTAMGVAAPEQAAVVATESEPVTPGDTPGPPLDLPPTSTSLSPDYKTICISMYLDDIVGMETAVKRCKAAGLSRMSKSQLIRIALQRLDVDALIAEMRGQR